MIKRFSHLGEVDIGAMTALTDSMLEVLTALDEGRVPDDAEYTLDDLAAYVGSLVTGQRAEIGRVCAGSWAVAPDDSGMDADARVDFVYRPTYIAVATLARVLSDHPGIAERTPGFMEALSSGLEFSSLRGLAGHGYDADLGVVDALTILSLGRVPWLLARRPDLCPALKSVIDERVDEIEDRLATGGAVGQWGEDRTEGFRAALAALRLRNDPEYAASRA